MTDMATTPAHRFTVGGALGFGFAVLRARPGAVAFLLVLQAVVFAALMAVQYGLMGRMAREGLMLAEAGDMVEALALNMRLSGLSSLFSVISAPLWLWLEAVWLVLFMSGRFTLWPGWGNLGRMTLGFIVIFGVYFAALIVLVIVMTTSLVGVALVQESGGDPAGIGVIALVLGLILFGLMLAGLALFTALPAHAVTGRFDIGQAVSTAWRHLVGVCIAWLVFFLVYLLAMAVVYGVYTVNVMDEVLAMMETISTRTEDPFIMMRLYAETLPTDQDLPWMGLTSASVMLIMGVIMLMGRGVSAKLALAMPAPSEKAD
ncbi:hypothetical protein OA2633_04156 [Oceanicaulis sp. HTCC2633]|uniref:hypothetical protein n=1 Tax=Oceanicaulis sp. HTCC2633 TaxID=314254 RepID=UPI000066D469|nr:hypothetical protein [Oceanicaulis sp. HTCC2633]EAP91339.1 hypothetical protein OA2633_04156 [Oceanicaulis sp. HTCC2633]